MPQGTGRRGLAEEVRGAELRGVHADEVRGVGGEATCGPCSHALMGAREQLPFVEAPEKLLLGQRISYFSGKKVD